MERKYAIGVDVGGSHITCSVVDLQKGEILRRTFIIRSVNNKGSADEIIKVWSEAIADSLSKIQISNLKGLGFALPGPFDYVKGICMIKGVTKYDMLYGVDVGMAIREKLDLPEEIQIRFINDASSFAVGESWAGVTANFNKSMAITLGTGLGSAFVEDNIPVVTGDSVPELGCVYHINYKKGIADDYFSTRWFTRRYKELTGREAEGVDEIANEASTNKMARGIFNEFGTSLARFLAPFLMKFGSEALIIGGNISLAYDLFGKSFEDELIKQQCSTKSFVSDLKEEAALLGSAYLFDDEFWNKTRYVLPYM